MAKRLGSKKSERRKTRLDVERRYAVLEAFDRQYSDRDLNVVAGVDEAGRGALAGPVVSAAVVLPAASELHGVFDSKQLSEEEREVAFEDIVSCAVSIGISFGQPTLIDRENILQTTLITMHRAVDGLGMVPDLVLVDGRDLFQWRGMLVAVTQGDSQSLSIAAASIVAKVARDRAMCRLHKQFPNYNFEQNKGYGTKDHLSAIKRHGAAEIHRRTFLTKIVEKNMTMF